MNHCPTEVLSYLSHPLIKVPENVADNLTVLDGNLLPVSELTQEECQLLRRVKNTKVKLEMEIHGLEAQLLKKCNGAPPQMGEVERRRRQLMSSGRSLFNESPKKGIQFLVKHQFLNNTPEDVAGYFFNEKGLAKKAIGDFIGDNDTFNIETLHSFIRLQDFRGKLLVKALRTFLQSFYLPGEAQKIDRIMEAFAKGYTFQNPCLFQNSDVCYVLSFSLIMLNTQLHNPAVKNKISLPGFISMNRGINEGENLDEGMLAELYRDILITPFRPPNDESRDFLDTYYNPEREGWLRKEGGKHKSIKDRWFILNNNCLYYFVHQGDIEPKGIIPLEDVSVRTVPDKPNCFEIFSNTPLVKGAKTDSNKRMVPGHHQVYRLITRTEKESQDWMGAVEACIISSPIHKLLESRKSLLFLHEAHNISKY
ncbi:hypothetical protein LOD99_1033 [Oopsacas minuta]|uniref:Uncharacterized protein n=1 Tax=Oopsacas minuta TaxID=111878 RepID=A0AAV7K113_9METZ|nr:hypothetical protein LOD99_1033 [Oopsacas minuta]